MNKNKIIVAESVGFCSVENKDLIISCRTLSWKIFKNEEVKLSPFYCDLEFLLLFLLK